MQTHREHLIHCVIGPTFIKRENRLCIIAYVLCYAIDAVSMLSIEVFSYFFHICMTSVFAHSFES